MQEQNFIGPSYTLRSLNVSSARTVNLYPEMTEMGGGKNGEIASLAYTPGLRLYATRGTGPIRAMWQGSDGQTFCVSGFDLYDVDNPTPLGSLHTSTGRVSMADNGSQLAMVDGLFGYVYSLTGFQQITDPDFPKADTIAFLDQYMIINESGTRRFMVSALSDATDWDGLDFASKEGMPDNVKTVLVDHREVFIFGERSTEVWFDSGDALFPLSRVNGGFMEHGIAAVGSACKLDNSVYWLAQDANGNAMVTRATGYTPVRVSTHAVELALQSYGDVSGATAYTYQMNGHSFYVLNIPNAGVTWVYDAATQMWHERTSTSLTGITDRHRADNHAFTGSKHLVGDYENGNIYEMTDEALDDAGAPIVRRRRWATPPNEGKRVFFPDLRIDCETGMGVSTGQGSDPQVMLHFSNDSGHTWGNEHWASAGRMGEYSRQVNFRRLGSGRARVNEIVVSDPVPWRFISAIGDDTGGKS